MTDLPVAATSQAGPGQLEPDAIGAVQDTVIGMANSPRPCRSG